MEVCGAVQRSPEVCRGVGRVHRGMQRCTDVCGGALRVCGGVQRCTEVCGEVHGGVHRGPWLPLATIGLVGDSREFEV